MEEKELKEIQVAQEEKSQDTVNTKSQLLYTNNEQLELKIKKIPFTIALFFLPTQLSSNI